MGNRLCDCDSNMHKHIVQNYELITDDVRLDCVICKRDFPPVEFNRHLDHQHFLAVRDRATGIGCECIICGEESVSIERHQEHLRGAHFLLDGHVNPPAKRPTVDSNSELRSRITEVRMEEVEHLTSTGLRENGHSVYSGWLAGAEYKIVEIEEREDTGLAERYAFSNLVWKPIFTHYLRTVHYAVCGQEGHADKSFLLMEFD